MYATSFHVEKHLLFLAFSGYTSLAVLNPLWNILDTFLFFGIVPWERKRRLISPFLNFNYFWRRRKKEEGKLRSEIPGNRKLRRDPHPTPLYTERL